VNVLLVVIDAASPRVFCPAVQTGRLRWLSRLADAGAMHQASVSIFPSITPAATAAIITGAYPAENGIVGAAWFDKSANQVAYYGDDMWVAAREGFGTFLRDFLVRLNGDRLRVPTLFERVEAAGRRAACFNYLVYRGLEEHRVDIPWLLSVLPGTPLTEVVKGPSTLYLGDFVTDGRERPKMRAPYGPFHRFGMDDAATTAFLCEAAAAGTLPEFTVAYFADNDYRSHEVGPHAALPVLDKIDAALGEMFEAAGGLERFLTSTAVIVTSDHGHCEIGDDEQTSVIRLNDVFGDFTQATLGKPWADGDEILICPNMRAAQVYLRDAGRVACAVRAARAEPRIDQVIWRDSGGIEARGYHVDTPRGSLTFRRGHGSSSSVRDAHGNVWTLEGDRAALGLAVSDGCVASTDYPNALERITGALDADGSGDVWVTAKAGCEFAAPGGKPHVGGGSHGALHALDSLSPVIATGPVRLPAAMRSVDLASICLRLMGIDAGNLFRQDMPRLGRPGAHGNP
jgi:predicted AlkP superfamily pyrophosphatase or phosphodiesterase